MRTIGKLTRLFVTIVMILASIITMVIFPHGEDMDAVDVLNRFIEKTQFIEDDPDFSKHIAVSDGVKRNYIKRGHTEEEWEEKTEYQKLLYMLLFSSPSFYLLDGRDSSFAQNRDMYIKNLDIEKRLLAEATRGDEVYDALVEVWDWHWTNWNENGIFINLFEDSTEPYSSKATEEREQEVLEDESRKELEELRDEIFTLEEQEALKNIDKSNASNSMVITIIIVSLICIGVGVVVYKNVKNIPKG